MPEKNLIIIEDDAQCKAILAYHGRLDALTPRDDCPRLFMLFADASMAYICAHYYGYDAPEDNGYRICIMPLSQWSKEDVIAQWKAITQCDEPGHGPVFSGYMETSPKNN